MSSLQSSRFSFALQIFFVLTNLFFFETILTTQTMPRGSGYNSQGNHYNTPGGTNSSSSSSYHCTLLFLPCSMNDESTVTPPRCQLPFQCMDTFLHFTWGHGFLNPLFFLSFVFPTPDSNSNGSYYYANDNGSTYYNSGTGSSTYTSPSSNAASSSSTSSTSK
jgi:hypothetical protein